MRAWCLVLSALPVLCCAQQRTLNDFYNAARLGDLSKVKEIAGELVKGPLSNNEKDLVSFANQLVTPNFPVDLTADPELVHVARTAAERALELDPKDAAAFEVLARALIFSGEYEHGIAAMKEAIASSSSAEWVRQRKETLDLLTRNGPRTRRQDPRVNNWAFPVGYKTRQLGSIGRLDVKEGKGPTLICVSLGYEASIFDPIVREIGSRASFYLVTPPGMPNASAPPLPGLNVSFGERTWSVGLENAILQLIKEKELKDVVLVADDYASPQVVLHIAERAPDSIAKVILLNPSSANPSPHERIVAWVDKVLAPKWYATVTKQTWAEGMPPSSALCRDVSHAKKWFQKSLDVPIPVLCEYFSESLTDDILGRIGSLKPKVLAIFGRDDNLFSTPLGAPQQTNTMFWKGLAESPNSNVQVAVVDHARALVTIDQPEEVGKAIRAFLGI